MRLYICIQTINLNNEESIICRVYAGVNSQLLTKNRIW